MRRVLAAAMLLGLVACGPANRDSSVPAAAERVADMPAPAPVGVAGADRAAGESAPPNAPAPGAPSGAVMLAYAYAYGIEAPADQVAPLMKAHQKICADAGAALCQVLGAATSAEGEDYVSAQLSLRGEPRWLEMFRARLEADAKRAGGGLKSTSTTTEDLTRAIVDTQARLNAQIALRDRLQALLRSRPGKLSELLEVERELARVQGEIDSVQSNLAVMRARVSMSLLTIDYVSEGAPLTDKTFAPIAQALQGFLRTMAEGFGLMITLLAALAPWALAAWALVWVIVRWRRRSRATRAAPPSTPAP